MTPLDNSDGTNGRDAPYYCLDVKDGSYGNGTPIQLYVCYNDNENQKWFVDRTFATDVGAISPWAHHELCLDAGTNPGDGSKVKIWQCYDGLPQQTWRRVSVYGVGYSLKIKGTSEWRRRRRRRAMTKLTDPLDLCLDATNGGFYNGNQLQVWTCGIGNRNQLFDYRIRPHSNLNFCVDAGSNPRDGSKVHIWQCYPGLLQQTWYNEFVPTSNFGYTRYRLNGTNLCLDVTDGNFANGQQLQVWSSSAESCTSISANAQADPGDPPRIPYQFRADAAGTKPPHPGYCLDLKDGVQANGTPVQLWQCSTGNRNQLWDHQYDLYTIRPYGRPDLCLDAGTNPQDGSKVKVWQCYPGLLQQSWEWFGSRQGFGRKLNGTNLCLDVTDGNFANGTPLQVWKCYTGSKNQWIQSHPVPVPY
ncbi:Endo-1,4-beta-xylanase A [Vanrija pseudolonga]|uniref:Endo-1,4-beta-xylanase A n=1 Tax=Vanrija pseudolonga TaxID=143232 RepID=A0AAF1BGK9_9TREE|nr:Endo-1,4-beta-xylanase A [Vanrija pseudolonga]